MRDKLGKILEKWMCEDDSVIFLAADIGGGLFKALKSKYPTRVINVGIAEQNMIGMAAGLSNMGFRVICYSKACFISLRVVDQVKNALCYASRNVILIGADAGLDESNAGHAHIAFEDIGVLNSLSEINIYMPTTLTSLDTIFSQIKVSTQPSYVRINKNKIDETRLTMSKVSTNSYYLLKNEGYNILILTYGIGAINAIELAKYNHEYSVLAVDYLSFDEDSLFTELLKYKSIIVYEEQFAQNGLYDELCRTYVQKEMSNRFKKIGSNDKYSKVCFYREKKFTNS